MKDSGFEEVVYQSGLCTSGSLQGVLKGSHYNRAWTVHRIMSESLERLLVKRFLHDVNPSIPEELITFQDDPKPELVTETLLRSLDDLYDEYTKYRKSVREGQIGQTAQWMRYLDLMRLQNLVHASIQEKNFRDDVSRLESVHSITTFLLCFE